MPYGEKFEQALLYAARLHRDQTRKGTDTPYVTHLLAVAAIAGENGGTEDEVVAALLHDAPEDRGGEERLEDIRAHFGDAVADIVAGCTDTYEDPGPPWRARKERYLAHLAEAPGALRVSLADKLDNVRALARDYRVQGEELWRRSGRDRDDARWYYRALVERFSVLRPGGLAEELSRAVDELERRLGPCASSP